jgi:glycosyltransferase involved in cell wall biosynthesis
MFFSLIIPAYNLEGYILDCLSSIHAQSCQDFECIVVDDGSTDGTAGVIERYIVDKPRFRLIRKQNGGVSSARNLGLEHAQGKYIWFIDGDDYIHPGSLAVLRGLFSENPHIDYLSFQYNYTQNMLRDTTFGDIGELKCTYFNHEREDEFSARLSDIPLASCCLCIKCASIGGLRFKEICTAEDALFALQLTFKTSVSATTDVAFYYYLQHSNSFIHKSYTKKAFEDYVVYIKSVMDMRGERGGLNDGYLAFNVYRSSLPFLYRKIADLANDEDRNWAWKEYCLLVDRLENEFGEHTVYYVKWIYRTHSRLLSWFFFKFRYWLRDHIVSNKTALRLYQKIRGIKQQ